MSEQELDRFVPLETSDGLSRPWYTRDEDRRRRWVQVSALSALAAFTLVVSVLLGRVDGGIRSLVGINERATEETRRVRAAGLHKIVAWCPCGRTLAANTFASGVPVEDEVCSGCFDNWGYDTSRNSLRATFPKTDYDPNEESSSHGAAPVHSFVYQMKKHNIYRQSHRRRVRLAARGHGVLRLWTRAIQHSRLRHRGFYKPHGYGRVVLFDRNLVRQGRGHGHLLQTRSNSVKSLRGLNHP